MPRRWPLILFLALVLTFVLALFLLAGGWAYRFYWPHDGIETRLSSIVAARPEQHVDCAALVRAKPLVLLALGQSNAGNHGAYAPSDEPPIALVAGADCLLASDPLAGATGTGGSIWRHLPGALAGDLAGRKVLITVLAVDATSIGDWTRPGSRLAKRLVEQVKALKQLGLMPDFVLWQQGEADARNGTVAAEYQRGLASLAALLNQAGVQAPLVLARSTVCRSLPNEAIRAAIEQTVATTPDSFVLGPDTDQLQGDTYRRDGCHLSQAGLKQAAAQWASVLRPRIAGVFPRLP